MSQEENPESGNNYLTRRERDAAIILLTAISISFIAGTISVGNPRIYATHVFASIGLFLYASGAYLLYRAARRAINYLRQTTEDE